MVFARGCVGCYALLISDSSLPPFPSAHFWLFPNRPRPTSRGKKEKYSLTPVLVHAFSHATSKLRAKAIGAGDHHSVVLTEDGKIFTFGAGGGGRLGTHDTTRHMPLC